MKIQRKNWGESGGVGGGRVAFGGGEGVGLGGSGWM